MIHRPTWIHVKNCYAETTPLKQSTYLLILFVWSSRRGKIIYSDRWQIRGCWGLEIGGWGRLQRSTKKPRGLWQCSTLVSWFKVVVTWVYTLVNAYQPVLWKLMHFISCKLCFDNIDFNIDFKRKTWPVIPLILDRPLILPWLSWSWLSRDNSY